MKHNFMTKMVSALLAVVLSTAAFSTTAFASGGEETTEPVTEQETAGDVSDLLSALAGSQVTVSVTENGIQFLSLIHIYGNISGAIWACMGYTVLLCFALFKTGSLSKSLFGAH